MVLCAFVQQATFYDSTTNTPAMAYRFMEKFNSRDNEGIQILLTNSDGLIEVSHARVRSVTSNNKYMTHIVAIQKYEM